MIIRPIQQEDNLQIAQVIKDSLREFGVDKPGTVYTDPTTNDLFTLFQEKSAVYFILQEGNDILGGCGIYPTKGLPQGCAELVKLYLLKKVRGKGLGKQLMQTCIDYAERLGLNQLYLESLPELKSAISLYEKMGFKRIDKPLGDSGHFACDLWMIKKLKTTTNH